MAARASETPKRRTFPLNFESEDLWIKRAARPSLRARCGYRLLRALALLSRREILRPRTNPGGACGLRREAELLLELGARGANVPRVVALAADASWLALAAIGTTVGHALAATPDPAARRELLVGAGAALGALHALGLSHGAPLLRNVTVTVAIAGDGSARSYGFLDFEDHPGARMQLARAQARDAALLLWSAARFTAGDQGLLPSVLEAWSSHVDRDAVDELHELTRFARRVRAPLRPFLPWLGGDLRRAALALDAMTRAESSR